MSVDPPARCPGCKGCGKVANTKDQEPWTEWTKMPLHSSQAVLLGVVRPVPCPQCNGMGLLPPKGGGTA